MNNTSIAKCFVDKASTSSSRKKNFDMSFLTFANLKRQTHCAYSGRVFEGDCQFTFERIDNSIGYVDGNVIAVGSIYNNARGDFENSSQVLERIKTLVYRINENLLHREAAYTILEDVMNQPKNKIIVEKPVISADLHEKWLELYPRYANILKQREHANNVLTCAKHKSSSSKKAKGRVHFKQQVEDQTKKLALIDKREDILICQYKAISNITKKSVISYRSPDNTHQIIKSKQDRIDSLSKAISKDRNMISLLETVAVALDRFADLSYMETLAVKFGLPLDASRVEILKHKMARNLLGDTI